MRVFGGGGGRERGYFHLFYILIKRKKVKIRKDGTDILFLVLLGEPIACGRSLHTTHKYTPHNTNTHTHTTDR